MRRSLLIAAFALVPSLASAQLPGDSRTFAGCDLYACATFTLQYTTSTVQGRTAYTLSGDGALTLLPPIVTGAYSIVPLPLLKGAVFGNQDVADRATLPSISLVGRVAGDMIPLHLLTGSADYATFVQPVLDLTSLSGTLVGPGFPVTQDRLNITLAAVPEPSTLALAGAGLLAVGGMAVRRRRASAV